MLLLGLLPYILYSLREKIGNRELAERVTKLEALLTGVITQTAAHREQVSKRLHVLESRWTPKS